MSSEAESTTTTGRELLDSLLAGLRQTTAGTVLPAGLASTKTLRARALERVHALTLPSKNEEAWRFTNIAALARESFQPLRTPTRLQPADIAHLCIEEAKTRLVFVDGKHAPQLSNIALEAAAVVGTLLTASEARATAIAAHLGQHALFQDALFPALNTAHLQDAAVLSLPRNTALQAPVHLLFISTQPGLASHPRILLVAEAGSALTLIEDHLALHGGVYLNNPITEVVLGANAQIKHVRLQRESAQAFHMASCAVSLGAASRYHSISIAMGARISRLDQLVTQTGDGMECQLDGLALIGANQLADTHSFIDHAKPHGVSRQSHKCIVGGAAHAVFNGQVMVRPGAQKTDSAQSSRNLLLTGKAVVDTQPQLEIFADDVKCTHGATVGQLDPEEVFYLQSRGLPETVARKLLTYAFGAEIIDRIPVASLKRQLEQAVMDQTTGAQS